MMNNRQLQRDMQVEFQARVLHPLPFFIFLPNTKFLTLTLLFLSTVSSQASPPRGLQGGKSRIRNGEADPGTAEAGRNSKSLPEGARASLKAGTCYANGPNGRHG